MKNLIKYRELPTKLILLLMLRLIYFSNPFGMTFISKLNLPSDCIIIGES